MACPAPFISETVGRFCGGPVAPVKVLHAIPDPQLSTHGRMEICWALTLLTAARLDDYASFSKVNSQLLNPPTPLKHVPIRIYIPSSPPDPSTSGAASAAPGSFRVMQSLVPPRSANRE